MTRKELFAALIALGVAGLLLHVRIHPFLVQDEATGENVFKFTGFLASLLPLIDVIVVTGLFLSRSTAVYGFLLNGLIVIYGTVFMGHYSIAEIVAKSIPPAQWVIKSTLADIGIAWADFFVGKALYDVVMRRGPAESGGR